MSSAVIEEIYSQTRKEEYIQFVKQLGNNVDFCKDKWVCDKLRRSPADKKTVFTLYFKRIPVQYRDMVKYFAIIKIIEGKKIRTVTSYIADLIRFFDFLTSEHPNCSIYDCNEHIRASLYKFLENSHFAESTRIGIWSSVNTFFKTMQDWDGQFIKNYFSISPYCRQTKFDEKYIPNDIALQLDRIFTNNEIALHWRCIYWLLRLIPSRIGEILGMRINCLKKFNGEYIIFIPTWKQNGGWKDPIMRSIHVQDTGIASYLISLIKEQQNEARKLQEYLPINKRDALFTYSQIVLHKNSYFVVNIEIVRDNFHKICERYNVKDKSGKIYKVSSHQFRHTGITDRLAAGFTSAQIAEMTGHHGDAMIHNAYSHLNLFPERIIEKQEFVLNDRKSVEDKGNKYILFGGRILNMEEHIEKRLLKNIRAHRVRGGICSDITGCKSDMWNCLECESFVPDKEQINYYKEQVTLWREKITRFANFPVIMKFSQKNAELFERVVKKLESIDN